MLPNDPIDLMRWLADPQALKPEFADAQARAVGRRSSPMSALT